MTIFSPGQARREGRVHDATIRDFQLRTPLWTMGKNFDGTGAFGPWLVTPDALPAEAHRLRIQGRLNGRVMQDASTVISPRADVRPIGDPLF